MMRAHSVTCFSTQEKGVNRKKKCAGTFAVVFEDLLWKKIRNPAEKPSQKQPRKAEAKKTTSVTCGRFAEGVASVIEFGLNKNRRSDGEQSWSF